MNQKELEKYPDLCMELKLLEKQHSFPYRREQLIKEKEQIEAFIDSLPDPRERMIVNLRAMQGMEWNQVTSQLEGRISSGYARQIYREIMKKYF